MADIDELQQKLKSFAEVVNSFKSEAVQLRVIEMLIGEMQLSTTSISGELVKTKPPKRQKRKSNVRASKEVKGKAVDKPSRSRVSGGPGTYVMVGDLLGKGYFKQARTIGAIIGHCGSTLGHHYKANEISPVLLRYLRDEKLKRQKNKDGQYEYTQT